MKRIFQQKCMICKETGKCDSHIEKKKAGNIVCIWGKQKYWFNRQKLQSRLYTYVQNTEKIMFEELKEGIVTMSHQEQ